MAEELIQKLEELFDALMEQGKEAQAEKIGDVLDRVEDGLEIRLGDEKVIEAAKNILNK